MPEPYYEDDLVTLYHGDCREVLDWLAADVLVTDPPYGISYRDAAGVSIAGDRTPETRDAALALWDRDRPALVFGLWRIPRPGGTRQVLIWDKGTGVGGSPTTPWGFSFEEVYVLGQWPPLVAGGRLREGGTPSREPGVIRVANYNTQSNDRPDHPSPKPPPLMERLIAKCPPGAVADPFAGSGSTLVAAKALARKSIGVELDERYCEIAAKRLARDALFSAGGYTDCGECDGSGCAACEPSAIADGAA